MRRTTFPSHTSSSEAATRARVPRVARSLPVILCLLFCCFAARAQDAAPVAPRADAPATLREPRGRRPPVLALSITKRAPRARALARLLDLTPEQQRRFGAIRRRYAGERREVADRLRRAEQELDDRLYADALDTAGIDSGVRRVSELHAELTRLRARLELELREVLTAEQLRRLRFLREEARARRPPLDASRRQRSS